jgi:peptide-methionine (S)-S-oxide reductase
MFSFRKPRSEARHPAPAPPFPGDGPAAAQRATFAAGCFWGVEAAFRQVNGVLRTTVGYTGGHLAHPSYRQVCRHTTGHAEAVEVWFDPAAVTYGQLLATFWRIHNPTTRRRQGLDFGRQYRSAVFFHDAAQQDLAEASRAAEQTRLSRPITTEITAASAFYPAEAYHQRYLEKLGRSHPGPTVRQYSRPRA